MVYQSVTETNTFPTQSFVIELDPTYSALVNTRFRFSKLFRRRDQIEDYILSTPVSTEGYFTHFEGYDLAIPPVTGLLWSITQLDNFASLEFRSTGDNVVNIAPDRFIPIYTTTSTYEVSGHVRLVPYKVTLSTQQVETDREDLLYLDETGAAVSTEVWSTSGTHQLKRIDDLTLHQFSTPTSFANGSFGHPIAGISFKTVATVSGDSGIYFDLFPDENDREVIYSVPKTGNNDDYCGANTISGTMDWETGDWTIQYNTATCGSVLPVAYSYLSASYLKVIDVVSPATITNITLDNQAFSLSSNRPLYLWPVHFDYASGPVSAFGWGLSFDAYANMSGNGGSIVTVTPKMRDKYHKFESSLTDDSIYRLVDNSGEQVATLRDGSSTIFQPGVWLNGTNTPFTVENDGDYFNTFTYVLEISSINDNISEYFLSVSSNSALGLLSLTPVTSSSDETIHGYHLQTDVDLNYGDQLVFDIIPDDTGIVLNSCYNGSVIPFNTSVEYSLVSCLSAFNMGLGTTTFLITSLTDGLTGSYVHTTNIPTSSYTFGMSFGEPATCVKDFTTHIVSAFFEKDDVNYRPPYFNSICWILNSDNSNYSLTALNRVNQRVFLDTCLPSYNNDLLTLYIKPITEVAINPESIIFNMNAQYNELGYSVESDIISWEVENWPSMDAHFQVLSGSTILVDTNEATNYLLSTGSHDLVFRVDPDILFNYAVSNVFWDIGGDLYSGTDTVSATLSSLSDTTICATLSVNNTGLGGWSRPFCFEKTLCINLLLDSSINFIAFPENRFNGSVRTKLDFDTYNSTFGNTAYDVGHIENWYISADPGYDRYIFQVGDSKVEKTTTALTSATNARAIVPYGTLDVNTPITISVSAFDYSISTTVPYVGYSDNLTLLTQDAVFYPYPVFNNVSTISEDLFNLNVVNGGAFTFNIKFSTTNPSPASVRPGSTAVIILSSSDSIDYTSVNLSNASTFKYYNFTTKVGEFFSIIPNTFRTFQIGLSAELAIDIPALADSGIDYQNVGVVYFPVTAYNGPFLELSLDSNCVSSNVDVFFQNVTPSFNGYTFIDFTFDDGIGNVTYYPTVSSELSANYPLAGTFTPILTAYLNGTRVIKEFTDFIRVDCGSTCVEYDPDINRTFLESLSFPFSRNDVRLKPNERLTYTSVNSALGMLIENLEYLYKKSKVYDLVAPSEVLNSTFLSDIGNNITGFVKRGDLFFYSRIENGEHGIKVIDTTNLYNTSLPDSDRIDILTNTNVITEGELFKNITAIAVTEDSKTVVVIDGSARSIYAFTYDTITGILTLKSFWGGPGGRSSKTKFTTPIDITIDSSNNLYVADYDLKIIKKYNNHFNWTSNIDHPDFKRLSLKPISITTDSDDTLYVLFNNASIYSFDPDGKLISKFSVDPAAREIVINKRFGSILYVVYPSSITKYTKDGFKINKFTHPNFSTYVGLEQDGIDLILHTNNTIYTIFDCLELQYLRDESVDSLLWNRSSIMMHPNEFVQDYNYNDSFDKLRQNTDIFRRSVKYKFVTYPSAEDPNRLNHDMVSIHESDIEDWPYESKIGINELVTYDVLNREIDNICDRLDILLTLISSKGRDSSLTCDTSDICWRWDKLATNGLSRSYNCDLNPFSWAELKTLNITNWYQLSCPTCSPTLYETINFTLSDSSNQVSNEIEHC